MYCISIPSAMYLSFCTQIHVYLQVESDDHPRQEPALVEFGSRIQVD